MITRGIRGYMETLDETVSDLHAAALIACEGLADYAGGSAPGPADRRRRGADPVRRRELDEIARICAKVPLKPAETLQEALQSLWITHMAVCLEGLNSAVSFGRIDQYLYPFYRADIQAGRIDREKALELLCASRPRPPSTCSCSRAG